MEEMIEKVEEFTKGPYCGHEAVVCTKGNIRGKDAFKRLLAHLNVDCQEGTASDGGSSIWVATLKDPSESVGFLFDGDEKLVHVFIRDAVMVKARSIGQYVLKDKGTAGNEYTLILRSHGGTVAFVYVGDRKEMEMRGVLS